MDLAHMIADVSIDKFKKECENNTCSVELCLRNRYNYKILVIPMGTHALVRYKTIEYKIPRSDKESWKEVVDFLIEAINTDCNHNVNSDIEYAGLWPDNEEFWYRNTLSLIRHNEKVFWTEFKEDDFETTIAKYMYSLRMLN